MRRAALLLLLTTIACGVDRSPRIVACTSVQSRGKTVLHITITAPPESRYAWIDAYLTDGEHRWRITECSESRGSSSSTGLFGITTTTPNAVKAELVFTLPETYVTKKLVVPPSLQLPFETGGSRR